MNVLLIISDPHRWDMAGHAGHPVVRTPHLDRLAADGVRLTQACCNSPLCVTSRASLLTGTCPHTCRALTNRAFPLPEMPTLGSVFRAVGEEAVNTCATYRRPLARCQTVCNPTHVGIALAEEKVYDHLVVDRCVAFLERNRSRPFFLWAGIEKPHPDGERPDLSGVPCGGPWNRADEWYALRERWRQQRSASA
jgi:hypothetical protein